MRRILDPGITDHAIDGFGQFRITHDTPSSEGDAVCLVVEFLRIDIIERLEFRIFEDFGMKLGNAVDGMREVDVDIGHMNTIILVNDLYKRLIVLLFNIVSQRMNDRHQLRYCFFQIGLRPCFKRFSQNCMVGIAAYLADNLNCFFLFNALCFQSSDQFRNDHGRMGIVDLYSCVVIEIMKIGALGPGFFQNQLGRIGTHEVFLIYTQNTAGIITVIRIQE